jgi:hypothetical protein
MYLTQPDESISLTDAFLRAVTSWCGSLVVVDPDSLTEALTTWHQLMDKSFSPDADLSVRALALEYCIGQVFAFGGDSDQSLAAQITSWFTAVNTQVVFPRAPWLEYHHWEGGLFFPAPDLPWWDHLTGFHTNTDPVQVQYYVQTLVETDPAGIPLWLVRALVPGEINLGQWQAFFDENKQQLGDCGVAPYRRRYSDWRGDGFTLWYIKPLSVDWKDSFYAALRNYIGGELEEERDVYSPAWQAVQDGGYIFNNWADEKYQEVV